jgi:hypothetical protein
VDIGCIGSYSSLWKTSIPSRLNDPHSSRFNGSALGSPRRLNRSLREQSSVYQERNLHKASNHPDLHGFRLYQFARNYEGLFPGTLSRSIFSLCSTVHRLYLCLVLEYSLALLFHFHLVLECLTTHGKSSIFYPTQSSPKCPQNAYR